MEEAISATLQQEVDGVLQQAAKHRGEMQRRVSTLRDCIRCRQVRARAEALTPMFRAELLRRAKAIQKNRFRLLQTLRRYGSSLPTMDLQDMLCSKNVEVVLYAVRDALQTEEQLANWHQPLPGVEAWREVCFAIRESGPRKGASPQLPTESLQRLEVALERLLFSHDARSHEEKVEVAPWISFPCFCTMSQFCQHTQLPVVTAAATAEAARGNSNSGGNNNCSSNNNHHLGGRRRMKNNDCDNNSGDDMDEMAVDSSNEMMQMILHAAATQFECLSRQADDAEDECEDEEEEDRQQEALEEARLRLSIEVAARVTACTYAVTSLAAGEDSVLFDGLVSATRVGGLGVRVGMEGLQPLPAVPITTLVLPPMEQLFYCIAYTVGAAILRDKQEERRATATTVIVDVDDGNGNSTTTTANNNNNNMNDDDGSGVVVVDDDDGGDGDGDESHGGWKDLWERWMVRERGTGSAIIGPRLMQYLLEYVFYPATSGSQSKTPVGAVALPPEMARRWLTLAFGDAPAEESAVDAMMALFTSRR